MKIQQVIEDFITPPDSFRIRPLVRINDAVSPQHLSFQLKSLKEQGFGGVFSYCERFAQGAPFEFLSQAWWDVVDQMAQICAQLGLEYWAYDEADWPSGSAGGSILADHPQWCWKHLTCQEYPVAASQTLAFEPRAAAPSGARVLAVVAWQAVDGAIVPGSVCTLAGADAAGEIRWTAPGQGEWVVGVLTTVAGIEPEDCPYVDLMDERVSQAFCERVYQGHWDKLSASHKRGEGLQGFFMDEPNLLSWSGYTGLKETMPVGYPFSPAVWERWQARWNEDPSVVWPLLFHDVDGNAQTSGSGAPDAVRVRCRYYQICQELLGEHFERLYDFCEARGISLTGHLWPEEQFSLQLAALAGNPLKHYRKMHIPGLDWVIPFGEGCFKLPANAVKYAVSTAHLMGRERVLCESLAGSGWGVSFTEMLKVVNWEHVNGVNLQVPISYKYSLRGAQRATFYPPGLSYQQPWWDHARAFADYEARVCMLVAAGVHVAQALLLYPEVDLWAHARDYALLDQRGEAYHALGDAMRAHGYDYDVVDDEALLEHVRFEQGVFKTSTESFDVLIVPPMDAARLSTMQRLVEWARQGAPMIFMGALPLHSLENGAHDHQMRELAEALLGEGCHARALAQKVWTGPGALATVFAPDPAGVLAQLGLRILPDLQQQGPEKPLVGLHRRLEDGELYLIMNRHDQPVQTRVVLSGLGHPELLDPCRGTAERLRDYRILSHGTQLQLSFEPYQLIPIMLHPQPEPEQTAHSGRLARMLEVEGFWDFEIEETMKRPDVAWNFEHDAAQWTPQADPCCVPYKIETGDWCTKGLETFSGLGHYRKTIELPRLMEEQRVVLDLGRVAVSARVCVNGQEAGCVFCAPYRLEITQFVRSGSNRLHVAVANTLSNYYSQFRELNDLPVHSGGDLPQRRTSGLLGPVKICFY